VTLKDRVRIGPRLSEEEVVEIGRQAAEILAYLHSRTPPLVHRDLKPSNLMLRPGGGVALIDFGAVVDAVDPEQGGSTIIGTFGYMPLEQYEGRAAPASDVYSLGATLVFALSGGKEPREMERLKMRLDYRPYVKVSEGLRGTLDAMLAVDPADRPQDGFEARSLLGGEAMPEAPKGRSGLRVEWLLGGILLLLLLVTRTYRPILSMARELFWPLMVVLVLAFVGAVAWHKMTRAPRGEAASEEESPPGKEAASGKERRKRRRRTHL
jgi:serine/threonine protein kinase